MEEFLEKIYRNFKDFFLKLDVGKRISLVLLAIATITTIAGILIWVGKTRYEVLYSELNRDDTKKISVLLEENKIPYQTTQDGKTIKIPSDMINTWRIKIATLGVQFSGTVGYEVFDKQSFGTTSFVQKINKQRALEGELVKTITYIRSVKRARVHLSIPESSPFVSEQKKPTASVVLEMNRGSSITSNEVKGIAQLVSSAVDGMRSEDVVIIDSRGKKLSENTGDEMTAYTANRVALEQKLNRRYEKQVEDILSKVVGAGKVIAKVNASLDFTQSLTTETSFDADSAAVLSEVSNSQNLNGSRPSPQGIPGARSNLPGDTPQPGIPETKNNVSKKLSTKNYQVPSKVTKSKRPTAGLKKISIAVMIDGKRINAVNETGAPLLDKDGKQVVQYEKWSQGDLDSFAAIIASTIGIDTKRGDHITIKNMEFAREDLESIQALITERENRDLIKNVVKYLTIGFAISLFFFLVVRPFVAWVTDNTIESVEDFLPKTLEELEKVQANQKLPGLEDALPQIEEKLNPEKIEGNMLREKIISLVEGNPAKASQIIHDMIHSRESNKEIA